MAIRTRKIDVKVVNDAKETQAMVYTSTIFVLAVSVCNFTLEGFPNAYGIALGSAIFVVCMTFLGFTFIPKVSSYSDIFIE